jgi:hypothetical protein
MNQPTFVLDYTAGVQAGNGQTIKVIYIAYDINLRITRTFNGTIGGTRSISGIVFGWIGALGSCSSRILVISSEHWPKDQIVAGNYSRQYAVEQELTPGDIYCSTSNGFRV